MALDINEYIDGNLSIYTGSLSPYLQGTELRHLWQLTSYTVLKIRSNTSLISTKDNIIQDQNFFDDTLGRVSLGLAGTGSQVTLDTQGRVGQTLDHRIERRDLGQTAVYDDDTPFVEADSVERNPVIIIEQHPQNLSVPLSLVQASAASLFSFDGVIEPLEIRRVVDLSSIELPYIARSIKADLNNTNSRRENILIVDNHSVDDKGTRPFLDSQQVFGNIDLPGAFSDARPGILPYVDSNDSETFYTTGVLDDGIRNVLIAGFVSSSISYTAAPVQGITSGTIYTRRGYEFSQNENFMYDSIAFSGLLRKSRIITT